MEFVPIVVILATVGKIVDFARFARDRDVNAIAIQLLAWAAGFGVVALAAHTPWAAGLDFGGYALGRLDLAAQLLVGISIGSGMSVVADFKKAVDNTQSAAVPPLVVPTPPR